VRSARAESAFAADDETAAPAFDTAAPDVETAAPDVETAAPDVETAAPAFDTAAPDVETGHQGPLQESPALETEPEPESVEEDTEAFLEKVFSQLDSNGQADVEEEGHGLLRRRRMGSVLKEIDED
jgi:hypothetical protein